MRQFLFTTLAAGCCSAAALAQTPVIDGRLDTIYCEAIVIQDTQTGFGNAAQGLVDQAFGSELDNAYVYRTASTLYLFLGGNLETNNNDLELFIDSRAGGQNRLLGDNPNIDANGLNRMGATTPTNGLRFDAGFEADYYVTVQGGNTVNGFALRVHYAELGNPGVGAFCGNGRYANLTVGGALTGGDAGAPAILCTVDNSNTAGVSGGNGVEFGGGAGVASGIEIAIPLASIGNPAGDIKITAMVNGAQHDFLSNQLLGGLFGGSNLGDARNVDLSALAFDQFFNVPASTTACGACCLGVECLVTTQANCTSNSGTFQGVNSTCDGNPCDAAVTGACCVGAACTLETASNCQLINGFYFGDGTTCGTFPCLTIGACCTGPNTCIIATETNCANLMGDYVGATTTCVDSPCAVGACCSGALGATCSLVREEECFALDGDYSGDGSTCGAGSCPTGRCCIMGACYITRGAALCTLNGGTYGGDGSTCAGDPCGPAPTGVPAIDGTCDSLYGTPLAIQDTQTQFGDSNLGQIDFANGSELDGLAAKVVDGKLYICIPGNLESNFNKFELFFDTRAGGQNRVGELANPDVDFGSLQRMGDDGTGNGLRFDAGFDADFYFTFGHGGGGGRPSTRIFANYVELADGANPGVGRFLGEGRPTNFSNAGLLDRNTGGTNPDGIRVTLNNSNIAGVTGGTGSTPGGGAGVTTGIEICIPLSALGNPTTDFKVTAFVNGGGHDFASNQFLGGLNGVGGGNLGEPRAIDLSTIPGDQCVLVPISSGPPCGPCADSNCDGFVTVGDIGFFVDAIVGGSAAWNARFPGGVATCDFLCANDTNNDGFVTVGDIGTFVGAVTGAPCN